MHDYIIISDDSVTDDDFVALRCALISERALIISNR